MPAPTPPKKSPPPTEPMIRDRRRARRVRAGRLISCRVRTGTGEAPGATLLDVSPLGAGLLLQGAARAGDLVVLEFPAQRGAALEAPAQVVYCGKMTAGRAVLGCQFTRPLTDVEVADLLG